MKSSNARQRLARLETARHAPDNADAVRIALQAKHDHPETTQHKRKLIALLLKGGCHAR